MSENYAPYQKENCKKKLGVITDQHWHGPSLSKMWCSKAQINVQDGCLSCNWMSQQRIESVLWIVSLYFTSGKMQQF